MRVGNILRLDIDVFETAVVLRPVPEPADGADEVALIRESYDGRNEQLIGENSARG